MSDFDSCYAMENGNLVLRGLINYSLPTDTAPYITGGVYTKGKVGFSNGRLDIRARKGHGLLSGFCLKTKAGPTGAKSTLWSG